MNSTSNISIQNITEAAEFGKPNLQDDYNDLQNDYKQLYIDIEWWITAFVNIAFPVFGGLGNILTFIVMQRGSLKDVSTCFYMSILAVADTGKYRSITEGCLNGCFISYTLLEWIRVLQLFCNLFLKCVI